MPNTTLTQKMDFDKIWNRKLKLNDNFSSFDCSFDDDLGCHQFLQDENEAKLYQKMKHGVTYLFFYEKTMIGYVTLEMSRIPAKRVIKKYRTKVEGTDWRYYPSLLIGRLAVGNEARKRGVGSYLCQWCIGAAMEFSEYVGCRYVIGETTDRIFKFYEKNGFKRAKKKKSDKDYVWLYKKIAIS